MRAIWFIILCVFMWNANADDPVITPSVPVKTDGKYFYYFNGDSLQQALQMYTKNSGYSLSISSDVANTVMQRQVTGKFGVSSNDELLSILADRYGFNWFIFSGKVYITSTKMTSQSVSVSPSSMQSLSATLKAQGLLSDRFGFSAVPSENKVIISGPQQYVDLVVQQISQLNIAPLAEQFAVYHLKYASATDIQVTYNDQQLVIPGIATILQSLLVNGNAKTSTPLDGTVTQPVSNQITSLIAKRVSDNGNNADNSKQAGNNSGGSSANSSDGRVSNPLIQADARLNTIVIRDKDVNLKIYQQLIDLLDVPAPLIQVEVLAINLDEDELEQAGVNWWSSFNGVGIGYNPAKLSNNPGNNLAFYYGQVNPGQVLVNNINNFVSSLQYLQKNKFAQTTSRPSLVTIDNLPAIMSTTQTIYVAPFATASGGQQQSETISSGNQATVTTSLSITPHVIYTNDNERQIKLSIVLQDGNVRELSDGAYPDTTQNTIMSQAIITESQSVLIAGYSKVVKSNVVNKIPGLGDIPVLGWFFKSTTTKNRNITTVYLVTPKIIWNAYKLKDYVEVGGSTVKLQDYYKIESK